MKYQGSELPIFFMAQNWKLYLHSKIEPYIRGHVLEVGAGIGGNLSIWRKSLAKIVSLTLLEPDRDQFEILRGKTKEIFFGDKKIRFFCDYLDSYKKKNSFDTIVYIDVLEHIDDDFSELRLASSKLNSSGVIIIVCPAHHFLYSEFDRSIGHFRRYDRLMYDELAKANDLKLERCYFLDFGGFVLSGINKLLSPSGKPTQKKILFWDKFIIPISKILDHAQLPFGRCIVGVFKRND